MLKSITLGHSVGNAAFLDSAQDFHHAFKSYFGTFNQKTSKANFLTYRCYPIYILYSSYWNSNIPTQFLKFLNENMLEIT